jgi:hypothetical protein
MRSAFAKLVIASVLALPISAAEMTGWIVDAWCGASNANGSDASRACSKDCIKKGSDAAFVDDKGQKVYTIANKDKVMAHLDHKVKVSGAVTGDKLTVQQIAQVK